MASECLYDFTLSEDDEGDDAISAAALKRNQLVSEYHNVRLEFIDGGGINEFNPKMLGVVQAGIRHMTYSVRRTGGIPATRELQPISRR